MRIWGLALTVLLLEGCVMTPLAWPPPDTMVLPCLYSDVVGSLRPDEQFFLSPHQPVVVEQIGPSVKDRGGHPGGIPYYRSLEWGPYFFISRELILTKPYTPPGKGEKVWGLQWYEGVAKVDGTRTHALQSGELCGIPMAGYVYTTTPKEMRAFRFREVNATAQSWDDQAGW